MYSIKMKDFLNNWVQLTPNEQQSSYRLSSILYSNNFFGKIIKYLNNIYIYKLIITGRQPD